MLVLLNKKGNSKMELSDKNRFKILMLGPGYGSNIEPWLNFFQMNYEKYELTLLCPEFKFEKNKFENIEIFTINKLKTYCKNPINYIHKRKYDIIYFQGGYTPKLIFLLLSLFKYKKLVFNFWGEEVVRIAAYKGTYLYKFLYKFIFNKVDLFLCNWYRIEELFIKYFPMYKHITKVIPWGLEILDDRNLPKPTKFTENILNNLPQNKIKIFWPKSILRLSRFDILLEALAVLKNRETSNYNKILIIIWTGNCQDDKYRKELEGKIKKYKLYEVIRIIDHPFVPKSDMYHLWMKADFAINFVDNDSLSFTVLEALLLKVPIFLSNIPAYRFINEKYKLNIPLINNFPTDISKILIDILKNDYFVSEEELNKRSLIVKKNLNFNECIKDSLNEIMINCNTHKYR